MGLKVRGRAKHVSVVEQELPAWLQGACPAREDALVFRVLLEVAKRREQVDDRIELVLERDLAHVRLDEADVGALLCGGVPRLGQEKPVEVEAGHGVAEFRQRSRVARLAAAEVEYGRAGRQGQRVHNKPDLAGRAFLVEHLRPVIQIVLVKELIEPGHKLLLPCADDEYSIPGVRVNPPSQTRARLTRSGFCAYYAPRQAGFFIPWHLALRNVNADIQTNDRRR